MLSRNLLFRFYLENLFRLKEYTIPSNLEWKYKTYKEIIQKNIDLYNKTLNEMDYETILIDNKDS